MEIKIEAKGSVVARNFEAHAVRGRGGPGGDVREVVEEARLGGERYGTEEAEEETRTAHSLTLPIRIPCT
jgi:hypothetical protein